MGIRKKRRKGGKRSSIISRYAQRTVNPEYYGNLIVSGNIVSGTVTSESFIASSGVTSHANWVIDDDIYRRRILTERYRPETIDIESGYIWAPYIPLTVTGPYHPIVSGTIRVERIARRGGRNFSFSG